MEELSLRALGTVTWVERSASLSRTAVELGMAQSAVSRHLAKVEARLGGPLFYRTRRGVTPTDLAATAKLRVPALPTATAPCLFDPVFNVVEPSALPACGLSWLLSARSSERSAYSPMQTRVRISVNSGLGQ